MHYQHDTIAAISTAAGTGAIGVIRVSGPKAIECVNEIFRGKDLRTAAARTAVFGRIHDAGISIDEVLVTCFPAPGSYTGEDLVEISCHGNPFIMQQILTLLLRRARLAEPGEFTQRAFLNSKMDLTQAEAVGDLLTAQTRRAHAAALLQMEGSLHSRIKGYLDRLVQLRTEVELEIDFVEQGLEQLDMQNLLQAISLLLSDLQELAATAEEGMIIKDGLRVCLVGAPNVGKSSIFNALLQSERAIVTPIPGTTRDYLEEAIALDGYLIRIFDTAGLRSTDDTVEQIGISRSYDIISQSHLVVFITEDLNWHHAWEELTEVVNENLILRIANKADTMDASTRAQFEEAGFILCSATSPHGLAALKDFLRMRVAVSDAELSSGILNNSRQRAAVNRAITSLQKAEESAEAELGYEFTAFDLQEASRALEEVIGHISTDDILHQIFENFCIGK